MERAKRDRIRIYAAAFAVDAATFGVGFALSWHAEFAHDAGFEILGYLGALGPFTYAACSLASGSLSDRVGSEPLYRTALIAYLGCLAIPLVDDALPALFLTSFLGAAAIGFFWPPLQRRLALLSPGSGLGPTVGAFNAAWCVGIVAGPIAASRAYDARGLAAAIAACAALAALALAALASRFPDPPTAPRPEPVPAADPRGARAFLAIARVANFTSYFVVADLARLFPRFADHFAIDVVTAGTLVSVIYAAEALTFAALRLTARWHYRLRVLAGMQLAAALGLAAMPLARRPAPIAVIFALAGAATGIAYYSSLYYGLALRRREGRRSGLHEAILGSGAGLGPLLGGWVGSATGIPWAPFAFGALAFAAAIGIEIAIRRPCRRGPGGREGAATDGARRR